MLLIFRMRVDECFLNEATEPQGTCFMLPGSRMGHRLTRQCPYCVR